MLMGSDLPDTAAVITKRVILDERDAYGMRPSIVVNLSVTIGLVCRAQAVRADTRIRGERC